MICRAVELALVIFALVVAGCGPAKRAEVRPAVGNAARLDRPRGIVYAEDSSFLYVLDRSGIVRKLTPDGNFRASWRMPDVEKGSPEDLCLDSRGRLLVADTHYSRVLAFSQSGEVLASFGSYGEADGQFIYPVGICVDEQDHVYVADYGKSDRIQKFPAAGEHLATWGGFGSAPGELQRPAGLAWHAGRLYVADSCNHRVQVFDGAGKLLQVIGGHGQAPGEFRYPYDVEIRGGNLLVLEYGSQRVQELSLEGMPLRTLGRPGRGEGELFLPWRICVAGDDVVVADTSNNRLVWLPL